MGFDPNKGGNGDTGNSGNNNVWDMGNFSYPGYGNVVYGDDLTNQNNSTDQNKDKAKITPLEDFGDGDDFTSVDLDNSANTSDRDYGKALRDAMAVNNVSYSPDKPIQIVDSGASVQDVSKNYNNPVYATPAQANVIDGGNSDPGKTINVVDDSSNLEPKDDVSVDVDAVKNRIQNGVDNDANKFNPGDPNIVREYEEDTGNAEKRGRVARIVEKVRKSGVGKAFVRATIAVLLLGSLVGIGAKSGLLNKKTAQNATTIEQRALGYQQESDSGSIDVVKALDNTVAAQSGEKSEADKLNNRVDIKLTNGAVLEGVDFSLGGDNSGVDMVDKANMDSEHAGAFTHAYSDWINGGAAREYKSALGNEDAMNALNLKATERMNERMGNVGLLTKNYYKFADFDNLDLVNQENMGKNLINLMKDPAQYNMQRAIVEQKNKEFAEKTTQSLTVLELNKDNYCSEYVKLFDENGNETNDISRVYRAEYRTDKSVNPVEGGALVMQFSDKETGLNYVETHPEVKEKWLRSCNLIKPGASDTEIQEAMNKWEYVGVLVVCGQDCWMLKTVKHDSSTTYKAEYITPRSSSTSTHTSISITPELPGNSDPKLDDGSGIHKEEDGGSETHKDDDDSSKKIIRRIYRGGNHHDDGSGIHESDKKKDDETPGKTPDKPSETPDKPNETPDKPNETPKDNEKVLEAKTDNVVGGNEFNSQKEGTATDQNAAPLAGEATNNATMESSGDQLSNREVATQSVIGEFNENNASVSKEEAENKSISTSVTNENPATNSSEAPADSFERQTVADEVVNESNGETAAQSSYDTSAAEANYDFYSAF